MRKILRDHPLLKDIEPDKRAAENRHDDQDDYGNNHASNGFASHGVDLRIRHPGDQHLAQDGELLYRPDGKVNPTDGRVPSGNTWLLTRTKAPPPRRRLRPSLPSRRNRPVPKLAPKSSPPPPSWP